MKAAVLPSRERPAKVAEAIHGEIQVDKEIKRLDEVGDLAGYDFAFVGYPIKQFGIAKEAADFLAAAVSGMKVGRSYQ